MAAGGKYCYFPNGDLVSWDTPCFPDEDASPCCGMDSGWTCLKNGLCYSEELKRVGRGSCTDHNWDSPNCPQYCTKSSYEFDSLLSFISSRYYGNANDDCFDSPT